MKAKEFIIELKKDSKPRNFVAKNASLAGKAGRHQDSSKKKDQEQGKVKHKKNLVPMESALNEISQGDYREKALKQKAQSQMGAMFNKDPEKKAKDLATFYKRERGLNRLKARDEVTRKTAADKQMADNIAKLPELKAEYERMKAEYKSLGGSNWQYADREQNLTDRERQARSMEGPMNNLWRTISAAEKTQKSQGVAEGSDIQIPTEDGITWQDIRLMAGEGKLTKKTVLQAIAVIRKQRREQGVAEGDVVEDSIRPNLVTALKKLGFKGPFKLGQLPEWMKELEDGRFDKDTSIMIGGDDPEYDPWVAKGYDYGYAYGMESGYQTGLSAQEVFKQAQSDTQNNEGVEEGFGSKLAGLGLAGAMALGAGGAQARVTGNQDSNINRLTGKPIATQQATDNAPTKAEAPKGFSKEYLQSVVDGKHPRPMVSVEKAKELLKNMSESSKIPFAGAKVGHKEGPAGQWRNDGAKKNKPARPGDLVGGGM